jgi:hypothetical protein
MRWISTVALQANLQGKDGASEGANNSEGARTLGGGAPLVGRACTPGGGHACLVGAHPPGGKDAHA